MRYFLELSYLGTSFHGWQRQPDMRTVQKEVESALSTLLQEKIEVVGCGRTDTGVHALQYFLHLDTGQNIDDRFLGKLNRFIDADISFRSFQQVEQEAHARFDATSRTYTYKLHRLKDPFLNGRSGFYREVGDIGLMNEAAKMLKDFDDFLSFCKVGSDQKTTTCKVSFAGWHQIDDTRFEFKITADRFLRSMVRFIADTLIQVGNKNIDLKQFSETIQAGERFPLQKLAPAEGLYLSGVEYPYLSSSRIHLG